MEHRSSWLASLEGRLKKLEQRQLLRRAVQTNWISPTEIDRDGQRLVHFGSNDYLGMSRHPDVVRAFQNAEGGIGPVQSGSGSSPLIAGRGALQVTLEKQLAAFEGTEAAIVFPSGFAANLGTIQAFCRRGDLIFCDELNHASLIDGCRLSQAECIVYPHNDLNQLRDLLRLHRGKAERASLVTESVFSMDGDCAPLRELSALADEYAMITIVDEAHATGVYGPHGSGLCEELNTAERIDIRIGTLSKALGSVGGFVVGSQIVIDWLTNFARPYIFSTALPPAVHAASLAAIHRIPEMVEERRCLRQTSLMLRESLREDGWKVGTGDSPIIPVYLGSSGRALTIASNLRSNGFFVPAIRPPSVPVNQALVRISLSINHSQDQVRALIACMKTMRKKRGGVDQETIDTASHGG